MNLRRGARFLLNRQRRKFCIFKERATCLQVLKGQILARYFELGDIPENQYPNGFLGLGPPERKKIPPLRMVPKKKKTLRKESDSFSK